LPHLKVFEDFDEKEEIFRETKSKRFSAKNLRYGRRNQPKPSHVNSRNHLHGHLCDDLYINFSREDGDRDHSTTYNPRSQGSISPNRSLQEVLDLDGAFEEQPPNFEDISDIQEARAEPANAGISDGPIEANLTT
jgi:hypothetical protein